ncbi:NADH-quinone oxidoreductase subunit M [Exilibacterium tricleocarpae]|uniref:NADH-quinone oxidoreductase subunit M n=1 Tax=Exilibacterium tricleocarpae TaxID=2591008 RepID=A0A545T1T1_9GAMM|nr:NADH-quinone oxidoreductase subunit M [Exilibacterium tricleocarpae]TQV71178.1 NADH-quinone oxidoreductase subunit M [Exilibacterium tricleocarpae]
MILIGLIAILFGAGLLCWASERYNPQWPKWIALAALVLSLVLVAVLATASADHSGAWLLRFEAAWIPRFGIGLVFAIDGLSLLLLALTVFLGVIAVATAWKEITHRSGFFYFNLLWTLAGVVGIFTALDLFLFFFFWEVMLIPMYFIIAIWGHENRTYAAIKFFIFTQVSGLLMLLAIVVLAFSHYHLTGQLTFNYFDLLQTPLPPQLAYWLMIGFFIAFVVKLPSFPFHTWLPDAHTQAPTAGSVILAGVLLKTGAYGLLRFVLPLFPDAAQQFSTVAMTLGTISVLYGASMAFAQHDVKRLVAYSSISHMGFITLAVFAANAQAYQGAVMTMLAHGLSSAALFALAGGLQHRLHTRDMRRMGGFWLTSPRLGAIALFFCLAALGLPGLANFIGEFLILLGTFRSAPTFAVIAALGMIAAPVYALLVIQKVFHGAPGGADTDTAAAGSCTDADRRELSYFFALIAVTVYLGFFPQATFEWTAPAVQVLLDFSSGGADTLVLGTAGGGR